MQKGVAGQRIGVQMVSASDGTAFTGSVTVYVTGDAGTQAIGSVDSGICTHEGNGYHSYAPAQAETNYDLIAFTFLGSGAVPVTVQVYTAINPVTAVPTASANATAVRSELTTELARIDTTISSRATQLSVDAIGTIATSIANGVTTLLNRITSDVATMFLDLIQMITGSGTADAQWTTKALENAASSSGSGARSVSITVLLDEIAQQSALVRLVKGAEKYLATTDEDGLAEFSVNDGTWRVSITLANTQFTPVDLVVNANVSQSYSLTALPALEASDPNKITGYWLCLSQAGTPESGVQITLTAMSLPANSTGLILDSASRSVTTGADGIASFTNLIPGVRYKVKRNSGREFYFVCPDYQSDPVDLASFIGT